jgi:VWFA-related protein
MMTTGAAILAFTAVLTVEPGEVRVRSGTYHPVTMSILTTLVDVGAVVRNRQGDATGGFHAQDFELLDNGKPQKISVFMEQRMPARGTTGGAAEAAVSRMIALYFDDANSSARALDQARTAAAHLIDNGLAPADQVGVFTDSGSVALDYTSDRKAALDAVSLVRVHAKPQGTLGICPDFTPYQAFAVSHHLDLDLENALVKQAIGCNCGGGDPGCAAQQPETVQSMAATFWNQYKSQSGESLQALEAVVRGLAAMPPGRKILAILSTGFATGDLDDRKSAIVDAALRGHVVIGALNAGGLETRQTPGSGTQTLALSEFMAATAQATGGRFIQNSNDAPGALDLLTAVPEISYQLGFTPDTKPDNRMHTLKVRLLRGGYQVEARAGYFCAEPKETAQQRIDRAMLANEKLTGVPAAVTVVPLKERGEIRVEALVDAKQLSFFERDDRSVQQLTFTVILVGPKGEVLAGKQGVMDLDLKAETLQTFQAKGIQGSLTFRRPAGDFQVRLVVREAVGNHLGAWTVAVR